MSSLVRDIQATVDLLYKNYFKTHYNTRKIVNYMAKLLLHCSLTRRNNLMFNLMYGDD